MPVLRIVKEYNNLSKLNGIVETDTVKFDSKDDGYKWVAAIQAQNALSRLDWDLIDYEWSLLNFESSEILENPTGGFVGKLHKTKN